MHKKTSVFLHFFHQKHHVKTKKNAQKTSSKKKMFFLCIFFLFARRQNIQIFLSETDQKFSEENFIENVILVQKKQWTALFLFVERYWTACGPHCFYSWNGFSIRLIRLLWRDFFSHFGPFLKIDPEKKAPNFEKCPNSV